MNRKTLLAALAAGSLMGLASVAQAVPAVVAGTGYAPGYTTNQGPSYYGGVPVYNSVDQTVLLPRYAPPAPLYEAVPSARQGYVWSPGHYVWDNGRYLWRGGEWMAAQPGYVWQAAHWQQRSDGSWYLAGGNWVRSDNVASIDGRRGPWGDRDRDGVINRDDRYPRDPGRY
jgi:hypothetical protein